MNALTSNNEIRRLVSIPSGQVFIEGMLELPPTTKGIIIFSHGSGSSRHSPRNNYVAEILRRNCLGTLLIDLLTEDEDRDYRTRFDIALLTERLVDATNWVKHQALTKDLPVAYFGASTGAASAIEAAARGHTKISAIVSRGGRPDLASKTSLSELTCPVLLLVGERDEDVIDMNKEACSMIQSVKHLSIIPNATHLFEETGTLEEVAHQAGAWLKQYLK